MRRLPCLSGLLGLAVFAARGDVLEFDFGLTREGELPSGWKPALTGVGPPPRWELKLVDAPSALPAFSADAPPLTRQPALAQLSTDPADERFPLLVYEPQEFGDFACTLKFQLAGGAVERMAGLAFRYQNPSNYYVVRASGRGNVRFYKFVDGQRSAPLGPEVPVPAGRWHELQVEARGNEVRARFNGQDVLPWLGDTSFTRGRLALFTKSDAVSWFTDLKVDYEALESPAAVALREALEKFPRLRGAVVIGRRAADAPWIAVAASATNELGRAALPGELDVIRAEQPALARTREESVVVYPVRDRNGEVMGALRLRMTTFRGQTDDNALNRGLPILDFFQRRLGRTDGTTP
jgi:hypothetical protein